MLYVLERWGMPNSLWWFNYILLLQKKLTNGNLHKFPRRFRMPYDLWKVFVERLNDDDLFSVQHRGNKDCYDNECSPTKLLSLAPLLSIWSQSQKTAWTLNHVLLLITFERFLQCRMGIPHDGMIKVMFDVLSLMT